MLLVLVAATAAGQGVDKCLPCSPRDQHDAQLLTWRIPAWIWCWYQRWSDISITSSQTVSCWYSPEYQHDAACWCQSDADINDEEFTLLTFSCWKWKFNIDRKTSSPIEAGKLFLLLLHLLPAPLSAFLVTHQCSPPPHPGLADFARKPTLPCSFSSVLQCRLIEVYAFNMLLFTINFHQWWL